MFECRHYSVVLYSFQTEAIDVATEILKSCRSVHLQEKEKNDRNGGIWQSGISKSLAENVQHRVFFVNENLYKKGLEVIMVLCIKWS